MLATQQVSRATVEHLDDPEVPLELHFAYTTPEFAQVSGTLLLAKLPWAEANVNSDAAEQVMRVGIATRKTDLENPFGFVKAVSHVQLTLPSGYTLKEVPAVRSAEAPYGSYRITYALNGNVITADRTASTLAQRVPAKDLVSYLDFGDGLRKLLKTPLILEQQAGH